MTGKLVPESFEDFPFLMLYLHASIKHGDFFDYKEWNSILFCLNSKFLQPNFYKSFSCKFNYVKIGIIFLYISFYLFWIFLIYISSIIMGKFQRKKKFDIFQTPFLIFLDPKKQFLGSNSKGLKLLIFQFICIIFWLKLPSDSPPLRW